MSPNVSKKILHSLTGFSSNNIWSIEQCDMIRCKHLMSSAKKNITKAAGFFGLHITIKHP